MGLCACIATDVVSILRKKREPFAGVHVKAEAVRAAEAPTVILHQNHLYGFRAGFTQGSGGRGQAVGRKVLRRLRHAEMHGKDRY